MRRKVCYNDDMENCQGERSQRHILIVEDEADIVNLLTFHLRREGYRVHGVDNGNDAVDYALSEIPDLVILDIMLPGLDGLEVCRTLRSSPSTAATPIMMLSARREELDKILGLELGADDYMVKPFSVRELVARVRAMLRRLDPTGLRAREVEQGEQAIAYGDIILYPERHQVTVAGDLRNLTYKEFSVLHLLMANAGRAFSREQLLEQVWGYGAEVDTRTVDVHIRYLRQKVEQDPSQPRHIETVRGVGYRFARR